MQASEAMLDKARMVVLFAFCLLNPFAGWAYLAQVREAQWLKPPSISDTRKPTKLAVLPLAVAAEPEPDSDPIDDDWAETFEIDFSEHERLVVVPLARTKTSLDPERDVLALGRRVHADLVLDVRALVDENENELELYARLIRMAAETVLWSHLFVGDSGDLADMRAQIGFTVLRFVS